MFKTLKDVDFSGRRVLVRVDFNVPVDEKGNVTDDSRIRAAIPTIKYLLRSGASKVILMSHLGRPDGKIVEGLRMGGVAQRLQVLMKTDVAKLDDCIGASVKSNIGRSKSKVFLLENLRFHAEEEKNDVQFAKELAGLADIYVNDAFGASHRAHASVAVITNYLPSCAGLLLQAEIDSLSSLFKPQKPFVAVFGGAKVSDKVGVIENIGKKADKLLVGGAMALTFLKAKGFAVGKSRVEEEKVGLAKELLAGLGSKLVLPVDFVVADAIESKKTGIVPADKIPEGMMGLDIGPETAKLFVSEISKAKTIVWNGPMGVFEKKQFSKGTKAVGSAIAKASAKAKTVAGGGDTVAAIDKFGLKGFSHISTGGGAMLEFLEGRKLPAIAALESSKESFMRKRLV